MLSKIITYQNYLFIHEFLKTWAQNIYLNLLTSIKTTINRN